MLRAFSKFSRTFSRNCCHQCQSKYNFIALFLGDFTRCLKNTVYSVLSWVLKGNNNAVGMIFFVQKLVMAYVLKMPQVDNFTNVTVKLEKYIKKTIFLNPISHLEYQGLHATGE